MAKKTATAVVSAKTAKTKKASPKKDAGTALPAPLAPIKRTERPVRDNATAAFGKARAILGRVTRDYEFQMKHKGNSMVDFTAIYERLMTIHATFKDKAFLKSTRDLSFDWTKFGEDVAKLQEDLFELVIDNMDEKATRMAKTVELTQDQMDEMWEEAQKVDHPREQIRGWSNLINNLRAVGGYDPKEQELRGGQQSGGNRRRRG